MGDTDLLVWKFFHLDNIHDLTFPSLKGYLIISFALFNMLSSSSKRAGRSVWGISSTGAVLSCNTSAPRSRSYNVLSSRFSSPAAAAYSVNNRHSVILTKLGQSRYTTERVLQLRGAGNHSTSKSRGVLPPTLYDATRETENCGVGLVASLKSVPSRKVVEQADEMLVRMSHRGGCGCDPASGDGAGVCVFFFLLLLLLLWYNYII